jgi:hypothetical protein
LRDGQAAVVAARRASELTKWKDKGIIDTQAAAYAETGDFTRAVSYQEQAIKGNSGPHRKEREARLILYRQHKPYRDLLRESPAKSEKE